MKDRWYKVFTKDFQATDGDNAVLAMAEFQQELYIATGRSSPTKSGNVYRLAKNGCKQWKDITPPWSTAKTDKKIVSTPTAMTVFKNNLYIATDQGQVWRTSDGEYWHICYSNTLSGTLDDYSGRKIGAMAVYKDHYLYIGEEGVNILNILRTVDGSDWRIDSPYPRVPIFTMGAFEVFDGYLYAGCVWGGIIKLWRTNGTSWEKYQEELPSRKSPLRPERVSALKAHGNNLYIGGYPGNHIWRTNGVLTPDGKPVVWDKIDGIKSGDVFSLESYNGKLYLGVSHPKPEDPVLYYLDNDKQWKPVKGEKDFTENRNILGVTSLLKYDGKSGFGFNERRLYIGTEAKSSIKGGSLGIWELFSDFWTDFFYEPNNTMATAKPLKLEFDPTELKTHPIKLIYLSLHSDDDDVDFFEIEFESNSSPLDGCFPVPKVTPSAPGGAGMFGVQHNQELLSIHVQEEYCRPLRLEIYRTKDDKEPYIKNYDQKNNIISNEIRIYCPSKKFKDKKFFLAIKPYQEPKACIYDLLIEFANKSASVIVGELLYDYWQSLPAPYPPPPFRKLIDPTTKYDDIDKFLTDSEKYLSEFIDYTSQIEQASLQHKLGHTSYLASSYDRAERLYNQSLSTYKELEIPTKEAEVLRSLGELNSAQGKTAEAVNNFEDAAQIHQQLEDEEGLAYDRMALGHHYLRTGKYYESLVALEKALALQVRCPDMSGELLNFLDQSEAFLKLDQKEVAVACHILAEELLSRIEDDTMSQEVDLRRETIAAQIGEQEFLELKEHLAEQAATVRYEAISEILKGRDLEKSQPQISLN